MADLAQRRRSIDDEGRWYPLFHASGIYMNAAAVILVIAYAMPGRTPDISKLIEEPSLEVCWQDAKAFIDRGIPEVIRDKGAIALYAGCKVPSDRTIDE